MNFLLPVKTAQAHIRWKKEKKLREEAQKAENPEKPQEPVTNDEKSA